MFSVARRIKQICFPNLLLRCHFSQFVVMRKFRIWMEESSEQNVGTRILGLQYSGRVDSTVQWPSWQGSAPARSGNTGKDSSGLDHCEKDQCETYKSEG